MANRVETDITVQRFGFTGDDKGKRLHFPRAETRQVEGRSGTVTYGATDVIFDALAGRLDTLRWTADAMSIGEAWLHDDSERFNISVDRIEMPREVMLTRADRGIEIIAPHVTMSEMRLTVKGPFGRKPEEAGKPLIPPVEHGLRQDRLRFLDSLTGRIYLTVKVRLDLPVLGKRSLDQQLKVPIQEGNLNFIALDDSLDWLEGAFLDIHHKKNKLALTWKVPIIGSPRELISWTLDDEAAMQAAFGQVPVRSLADFAFGGTGDRHRKSKTLQALTLDAIDVALSLVAPRSLDVGGGIIMFGGDDEPGMVDFKVTGSISDKRAGQINGTIGSIDTTIKDVRIGPAVLTADRLHFDGLDQLEVVFDGFNPTSITVVIHRVTATNLALQIANRD